ncbi:tetratricopeptide repeat protein [Ideonella livida]|uniref:Tetratricopeptide repeat protein n=1 Tax=Ideonella livida TaxID=2707176 RepID=A0A7C9PFP8_9BURK|nr:tetratricopeptide repeat protein [Ideonella livida]NDY89914.1 tetratricopeptide repeat protein [Ideonella livida]
MLTVVIARYKEDLGWLHQLPADARLLVYNKGPELAAGVLPANARVIPLENQGRESDTYLHHLMHDLDMDPQGFTLFTQGGPFEHAPWLLDLVELRDHWRDVQPLSVQWLAEQQIPPGRLVKEDQRDWIEDVPVRPEHYSLHTWAPLSFHDVGAVKIGLAYHNMHGLKPGTHIGAHFWHLCGLHTLAAQAAQADLGVFSYGAIFAVRNARLHDFVRQQGECLPKMRQLSRSYETYGYMFERSWLHFFGEPCLRLPALGQAASLQLATEPAQTPAAASPQTPAQDEACQLADVREQAFAASRAGDLDGAIALLGQALQRWPGQVEVISDLAALALSHGEPAQAATLAQHALKLQPEHGCSLYTLAMSQEATGQAEAALHTWLRLADGAAVAHLREQAPELIEVVAKRLEDYRLAMAA